MPTSSFLIITRARTNGDRESSTYQNGLLLVRGERVVAVNVDAERVRVLRGMGDADEDGDRGRGGGTIVGIVGVRRREGEVERAEKGFGERIPEVGSHHEQTMATHGSLQIKRSCCFPERQIHHHSPMIFSHFSHLHLHFNISCSPRS